MIIENDRIRVMHQIYFFNIRAFVARIFPLPTPNFPQLFIINSSFLIYRENLSLRL
jgi:hypothetical protein